ncbi:MAG TPA: chemotaxis protein CheV [Planctomycetes bacterium]|nr:chemotaxis protein CheV [Fuerstiella sp.]HIK90567.1 chemotaxis protein CheV [Planctomycetota bacterium]
MASVGNILLEKDILQESGTNEVEILVFHVGDYALGINVAKVREVLPAQKITRLPKAHRSIVGCFTLRDSVVPCVSLHKHLDEKATHAPNEATIILTEFNQYQTAFVVDSVDRIHRVSWEHVLAAPSVVTQSATPVTAVTTINERLITMLDFEMIADQVSEQANRAGGIANPQNLPRHELQILLADDSATVRQAMTETLRGSGYTNLTTFENGEEAWTWIQRRLQETGDVNQVADLLVSDVEMPQIGGFHLTRNIKEHPELRKLYVLLFSSIMTEDNRNKGAAVQADAMITKPELHRVVDVADELLRTRSRPPSEIAGGHESARAVASNDAPAATVAAETNVSPTTESSPVPGQRHWVTFRNELNDRVEHLTELCQLASNEIVDKDVVNDSLRSLHSIKSAAMAIAVQQVAGVTHVTEGKVSDHRDNKGPWPGAELEKYVAWLKELVDPMNDENEVQTILARADALTVEIAGASDL